MRGAELVDDVVGVALDLVDDGAGEALDLVCDGLIVTVSFPASDSPPCLCLCLSAASDSQAANQDAMASPMADTSEAAGGGAEGATIIEIRSGNRGSRGDMGGCGVTVGGCKTEGARLGV